MVFARKVWNFLVGIKDGLVLCFMLLFFAALYMVLTARPNAGLVRDGALLVKLDGVVVEEPAEIDPLQLLVSGAQPQGEYRARDVARAIRAAAADDRIKAVVLDLSKFAGGGMVHMQEIGAAMDAVRAAKKPVLVHAGAYMDDGVMLAAHSSEAWVDPMGGAIVTGPGGTQPYFGPLLDRFKITAHVYKVGTYKDFVEPFIRDSASQPSLEARRALYAAVFEVWKADVAKARPKADITRVTTDPVGWITASGGDAAKAAVTAGLVDRIGDRVAFGNRVKELVGADTATTRPGSFAHTSVEAMLAAHPESTAGKAVAVVTVAGSIVDGDAGPGSAGGDRIARLIDEANADKAAALVLRVDSPGGSVMASELIRGAIERFKAGGRPVVVSMANLAASGGYWVSTPAERIFAEPATITGSIGIFAILPSFERTLADYGIKADGVRTTPLSGQPDVLAGFTPEVDSMIQASIDHGYARFVGLVAQSRKRTPEQIDAIAQGRVWDGGTARQNGLVDQFGDLDDALSYAAKAAKLEDDGWHAKFYGRSNNRYASLFERLRGKDDDAGARSADLPALLAGRQEQRVSQAIGNLRWMVGARGAQAYCLECPVPSTSARPLRSELGWLARLGGLIGVQISSGT